MKKLILLLLCTFMLQTTFAQEWVMTDEIHPDDISRLDYYGDIEFQDDNYLIVSCPGSTYSEGTIEVVGAGAVYIYGKSRTGRWQLSQKLYAPQGYIRANSSFGGVVCMNNDNLFISDISSSYGQTVNCGSVFFFKRADDGHFDYVKRMGSPNPHEQKLFGSALAMNDKFLFVGAKGDAFDADGEVERAGAGSVEVFKLDENENWGFVNKWVAPNRGEEHNYGANIALSGNGLVVGENGYVYPDGDDGPIRIGRVHYYDNALSLLVRDWKYRSSVHNPNTKEEGSFGTSIALDGNILAVGDPDASLDVNGLNPLEKAGLVYVYSRNSITNNWFREAKFDGQDRDDYDLFGNMLDLNGDFLTVGHPYDHTTAGSVMIYSFKSGTWTFLQKLQSANEGNLSGFGHPSIHEGSLIIGDIGYFSIFSGGQSGSVFIYEYETSSGTFEIMQNAKFSIYPNPAEDIVTIDLGDLESADLSLRSLTGAEMIYKKVSSSSCKLDVSELDAGIYLLSIHSSEGIFTERIIVK